MSTSDLDKIDAAIATAQAPASLDELSTVASAIPAAVEIARLANEFFKAIPGTSPEAALSAVPAPLTSVSLAPAAAFPSLASVPGPIASVATPTQIPSTAGLDCPAACLSPQRPAQPTPRRSCRPSPPRRFRRRRTRQFPSRPLNLHRSASGKSRLSDSDTRYPQSPTCDRPSIQAPASTSCLISRPHPVQRPIHPPSQLVHPQFRHPVPCRTSISTPDSSTSTPSATISPCCASASTDAPSSGWTTPPPRRS